MFCFITLLYGCTPFLLDHDQVPLLLAALEAATDDNLQKISDIPRSTKKEWFARLRKDLREFTTNFRVSMVDLVKLLHVINMFSV